MAFIIIKRDDRLGERHMAIKNNAAVRKKLRILFNLGTIGTLTDGQILERFACGHGETRELAFAALVERHGPTSWGRRFMNGGPTILRVPIARKNAFAADP